MNVDTITRATVTLTKRGGRGVLIPGDKILTAAHCIEWSHNSEMALGERFLETVETSDGRTFCLSPIFVEGTLDIAVLEDPCIPELNAESAIFNEWCDETAAVPLSTIATELDAEFPIKIWSHEGKWIQGRGHFWNWDRRSVHINADEQILGGTSGSPVIDEHGGLLGVVSHCSDTGGPCDGEIPFPPRALSVWLAEDIIAQTDGE